MGLAKNSVGTFISQIIALFLQFFIGVMTARFLGPEGKGLIYILLVSITISLTLGSLGLGPASIYLIGKDRESLPAVLGNLLVATGVISLVFWSVGWLVLQYGRPHIYAQFPLWMWIVVAFLAPIYLLQSLLMQVLSAILRINEINIVEVTRVAAQLLLFGLFVIVLGQGIDGAFLAYALSACFAAGAFLWLVLHYSGRPKMPEWMLFSSSLRFGAKAYLSDLLRLLNLRLDALLVASLAIGGISAAGEYSVATSVAELILSIPVAIRLSLFPMVAATNSAEANRLTSMACRHTMFLTILVALGFAAFGPFLIQSFYGEAFASAVIPFLILLPGTMLLCQALLFYSALDGCGKPGASSICRAASLLVILILDLTLIPLYGIIGAAVASTCAYAVEFVIAGLIFIRHANMTLERVLVFRGPDLLYYMNFLRKSLPSRKGSGV